MKFIKRHKVLTVFIVLLCIMFLFGDNLLSKGLDWFHRSMDYERELEVGHDFTRVFYRDGTYRINYHSGRYSFDYVVDDELVTIFPSIINSRDSSLKKYNLYIWSEEGYVMLEKGNKATFYLYEDTVLPDVVLSDERVSVIRIKSKKEVPFRKVFTSFFEYMKILNM